jgi:hypothetical protein
MSELMNARQLKGVLKRLVQRRYIYWFGMPTNHPIAHGACPIDVIWIRGHEIIDPTFLG